MDRNLFPAHPVILTDLVTTAVRTRVRKVLEILLEKGEGEETVLFLYSKPSVSWVLKRSWDQTQNAYFLSHRAGLRVRDSDHPAIEDFTMKLIAEITEVVARNIVVSVRAVDVLGLPSLQEIADQDMVRGIMRS